MDLLLNEEQVLLRDAAAKLGAKSGPRRARALRDAGTEIDTAAWADIVKAGWLSALVAEKDDGLGLGMFDLALTLEETGKQIVMTPLVEVAAAIWAVNQATASGHPARARIDGKIVVPATTLPGQRYDSAAGVTFDPKSSTLSGAVSFVPFGASADLFLVDTNPSSSWPGWMPGTRPGMTGERDAENGQDTVLCLVPRNAKGLTITTTPNVDGSTSSTLTFSGITTAASDIVARGEKAAATVSSMQELLVLGTAAELLGVAEAALDITVGYTKLREQFGKLIGSFQALQHRMVDCYVDAELNRSLLYKVLSAWDDDVSHPAMVSAVKARVGKGALKTVRAALQLHGAIGYTDEHDIGIYYKRAVALAAKYGNEITHVGRFSDLTQPAERAAE
jgi:alkylation response protein AidB-like acyl-CoA dehydrogenase